MSQPSGYNFFGQQPPPSAQQLGDSLAKAMQMPEYNNATSPDALPYHAAGSSGQSMGNILKGLSRASGGGSGLFGGPIADTATVAGGDGMGGGVLDAGSMAGSSGGDFLSGLGSLFGMGGSGAGAAAGSGALTSGALADTATVAGGASAAGASFSLADLLPFLAMA